MKWWKLTIEGKLIEELTEIEKEFIAEMIKKGYIEGELIEWIKKSIKSNLYS